MAHHGWLCLGGNEIVNNARASAYAEAGWKPPRLEIRKCGSCGPEMGLALEETNGNYNNPWTDKAPWLAASEPDSYEFGGFLVTSIDGLGPGPTTRDLTQKANGRGSFIGAALQSAPVITVNGILFGRTCCGTDYGLRWLSTMVQGSCDSDCDGDELTFLDCCPDFCEDDPEFESFADCLEPHIRHLRGVKLVSSPEVVQRFGSGGNGCCNGTTWMTVRFQLAAEQPCVYRDTVIVDEGIQFDPEELGDCDWLLVPPGSVCTEPQCVELDDCLTDPNCAGAPKPPTAPPPTNPCVCDPVQTRRACGSIPAGSIPEQTEGLPYVVIRSGSKAMLQVRLRFWLNPRLDPVDTLDPCNACGEVTLSRIPAYSEFVFDGSERTATITCPGSAPTDATPLMGSSGGTLPISWPEIQCAATAYTVCLEAEYDSVADDASMDIGVIASECAG